MTYGSKEFYEVQSQFEKDFRKHFYGRLDREARGGCPNTNFYQDGQVNELFRAYMLGVGYGKLVSH